jgi:23S rRNA (guanosine2251-2'-O)-methyltransferase
MSKKTLNSELNRKTVEDFKRSEKTPLIIILDDVRSLNNIGSVFRTADAFLVEKIYLCGITACPPHKEIHKTALGATDTVAWAYCTTVEEAISELRQEDIEIWSIEQVENSVMLNKFEINENKKYAIIFGNEVKGVSEKAIELSDGCIEIPQLGTKHSLNISVSAGIVVWDFAKKLCNFG